MKHGYRRFDFDKAPAHWCWRHAENAGLCFQKGVVRTFAVLGASICRNPVCRRCQDLGFARFEDAGPRGNPRVFGGTRWARVTYLDPPM